MKANISPVRVVNLEWNRSTGRWHCDGQTFTTTRGAHAYIDELKHQHDVLEVNDHVNNTTRTYRRSVVVA